MAIDHCNVTFPETGDDYSGRSAEQPCTSPSQTQSTRTDNVNLGCEAERLKACRNFYAAIWFDVWK
jgi:hypothetical protein